MEENIQLLAIAFPGSKVIEYMNLNQNKNIGKLHGYSLHT